MAGWGKRWLEAEALGYADDRYSGQRLMMGDGRSSV